MDSAEKKPDRREHCRYGPEREHGDVKPGPNISDPTGRSGPTGLDNLPNSPSNTAARAYTIGPQKRSRPQCFPSEASAAAAVASWPLASLRMCDCAERGIGEGFAVLAVCDAGMTTSKGRKDPHISYTARSLGITTITKQRCPVSALTLFLPTWKGYAKQSLTWCPIKNVIFKFKSLKLFSLDQENKLIRFQIF